MASTTYGTYPENHDEDHSAVGENHDDRKKDAMIAGNNEYDYDESDTSSVEVLTGVSKVEAAQAVWGPKSKWFLFFGIAMASYIYSLDGTTTWQYLYYATSNVLEHSLSGTITTAQGIIIAVGKPLMAKLADVVGRGETFIIVTLLYVIGYIVIATANDIGQIAAGEILYTFGYTGLQMLQQIIIADMTSLRYRGLVSGLVSAPFIINNFIAAQVAASVLPNWRWGYGMFAILIPVALAPIIVALLWAQNKAKKQALIRYSRPAVKIPLSRADKSSGKALRESVGSFSSATKEIVLEMDLMGLVLVAASLALILLPLGLAPAASQGWRTPSMIAMIVVGIILFPIFIVFEWKFPKKPVMPMRWLKRGPILGACLIGFFDFVSFYLQYTYLYSYVSVTQGWSYANLTYFSATQSLALTIFGILGGIIMFATQRFKWMLFGGLLIRLLGVGIMIHARSPAGNTASLVMCQVLQGLGGGFAAISIQVSAQAAVAHVDVATVTAMVLLITEVGNAVGSAIATAVWTNYMPSELAANVPTTNSTLLAELFGSITIINSYTLNDPIRLGAIAAYQNVMYRLVLGAVIVAVFPPIFCYFFTKDIKLTRAQNALDGKDLAGRPTGEPSELGLASSAQVGAATSPSRTGSKWNPFR